MITQQQRKYIFVLCREYGDIMKYDLEEAKEILKLLFLSNENAEPFSLSISKVNPCSKELAAAFIDYIITEIEEIKRI